MGEAFQACGGHARTECYELGDLETSFLRQLAGEPRTALAQYPPGKED
jgi:hypothetical protein